MLLATPLPAIVVKTDGAHFIDTTQQPRTKLESLCAPTAGLNYIKITINAVQTDWSECV